MLIARSIPDTPTVDNYFRYTQEQRQAGGRIRGEQKRLQSRPRHAEVRRLHSQGYTQSEIARQVQYHRSTVSRILRGVIRTCLTASETAAHAVPYPLARVRESTALRKLFPSPVSTGESPTIGPARRPKSRTKKPWNFFKGRWADCFRRKFSQLPDDLALDADRWRLTQEQHARDRGLGICLCGLAHVSLTQCCPLCGLDPRQKAVTV